MKAYIVNVVKSSIKQLLDKLEHLALIFAIFTVSLFLFNDTFLANIIIAQKAIKPVVILVLFLPAIVLLSWVGWRPTLLTEKGVVDQLLVVVFVSLVHLHNTVACPHSQRAFALWTL